MRTRTHLYALALTLAVTALVAGCGGDSDGGGSTTTAGGDGPDLVVVALDSLDFDEDAYETGSGEISVEYRHTGTIEHTLLVEGYESQMRLRVSGGSTDRGSLELEPGEYVLYCDIAGHRAGGMEATLTVD